MISYEFPTLNRVDHVLEIQGRGLERLTPLWELFGKEFYQQETALFARAPWVPLSPGYAKQKQEQFGGKSILRARDDLFKSFTQQGATGNIYRVDDRGAEFGSGDFKAIFHQAGTSLMPARPPLAEPDLDRYATIAGEYLAEMIAKAA